VAAGGGGRAEDENGFQLNPKNDIYIYLLNIIFYLLLVLEKEKGIWLWPTCYLERVGTQMRLVNDGIEMYY
jgi:hypothetical protein